MVRCSASVSDWLLTETFGCDGIVGAEGAVKTGKECFKQKGLNSQSKVYTNAFYIFHAFKLRPA
jgi:hypothetical protein